MKTHPAWIRLGLVSLLWLPAAPALATGIDFVVARNAAGKLVLAKPDQVSEPYRILPGDVDSLPGHYLTIEPGWDGLGVDEAAEGRLALADGARIVLRRVRFDDGFSMYDLNFDPILDADGAEETLEGEPEVEGFVWHEHLVFGVAPDQPLGKEFSATFVVVDAGGQHTDSDEFTLTFITASTPAIAGGATRSTGLCGALGLISIPVMGFGLVGSRWWARRRRAA